MAENDAVTDPGAEPVAEAPSLELPSLFGRRKKRSKVAPAEASPEAVTPPEARAAEPVAPEDTEPTTVIPVAEPVDEPRPDPVVGRPARDLAEEPVDETQPLPRAASPEQSPVQAEPPVPPPVQPDPPAMQSPPPVVEAEPTVVAPQHTEDGAGEGAHLVDAEPRRRRRTAPRLPTLAATTAALAVGAVIGLLGCALTYLGLKTCELITSTDSCGGPGLLLLLVIVVVMVLVGAALLRLFTVEDPVNLSVLGVGITVAVVLMFLLDYLYEPWMFVVMPVLTAAAFLLARWITTRYVDDVLADDDETEVHDIR